MNDQDKDRQRVAIELIKDHFGDAIPETVRPSFEVAESNQCWPCVKPYFDQLLAACEQSGQGWTKAQSNKVRVALFE